MKYSIITFFLLFSISLFSQNEENNEDSVAVFYQCPAEFIGGYKAMIEYISSNLDNSIIDYEKLKHDKAYITFYVEKDGSVTDQNIVNKDRESVLLKDEVPFPNMPKWKAACDENGDPLRELVRIPLNVVKK
ncbi:MAG: hypothetical protein COA32_10325 [Fluviicola sp.]|nr:MAG: hypothetical protein COA32_10325 [Fluviicola sp.]